MPATKTGQVLQYDYLSNNPHPLGEKDALEFCQLHGMSDYDAHFVAWLVRYHLFMSNTAQREDISDPGVVMNFVDRIGDQEHLDNLYLLTIADIAA